MKVGYLFLVNQNYGGVYQYSLSFLNSLSLNKTVSEITIYTRDKNLEFPGARIKIIKHFNFLFFSSLFFSLFNIYPKLLFKKNELLVSPTYTPLLFLSSCEFIFTLHDLQEIHFPENFSKQVLIWRNFIYKKLAKLSKFIITESNYVKADIVTYLSYDKNKIIVAESPPIFDFEEIDESSIQKKYNLIKSLNYIFFPAQFWKHKNHKRVINSFSKIIQKHANIYLIITGRKSREYSNIIDQINKLNISKHIIHLENIYQSDMPYFFKNSITTIAPTLHESISIPVFEAFYFESPVCASGILAIKDQVSDAGLQFNPTDENSIFNALDKMLSDKNLRQDLKLKGKKRLSYFSHERFNNLISPIFNDKIN
jgi:glycosyltransferase involved in cell wall biosynthesis